MRQKRSELKELKETVDSKRAAHEAEKTRVEEQNRQFREEKQTQLDIGTQQKEVLRQEIEELKAAVREKEAALEIVEKEILDASVALEKMEDAIPDDSDVQREIAKLETVEEEVVERTAEMEKQRSAKKALEDKTQSEVSAPVTRPLREQMSVERVVGGLADNDRGHTDQGKRDDTFSRR